jgi:hypothetical protein
MRNLNKIKKWMRKWILEKIYKIDFGNSKKSICHSILKNDEKLYLKRRTPDFVKVDIL